MRDPIRQLQSPDEKTAKRAERELIRRTDPKYIAPLVSLLFSWNSHASIVLSRYPDPGPINDLLIKIYKTATDQFTRQYAIVGLGDFPDKRSLPFLKTLARRRTNLIFRTTALYAIYHILAFKAPEIEDDVYELFADAINDSSAQIRCAGFTGLYHMRSHDVDKLLARSLKDPDYIIRKCHAPDWNTPRNWNKPRKKETPKR